MVWKNIAVLVVLAWVTVTQAAPTIVSENMDDSTGFKIEKPSKKKNVTRDMASKKSSSVDTESDRAFASDTPEEETEDHPAMKYWRLSDEALELKARKLKTKD